MKNTILLTLFLILPVVLIAEEAISVAKLDYSAIKELLEKVVLSNSDHKELRERYHAGKEKADAAQMKMQKAIMRGEKVDPMEAASQMMTQSSDKKKVEMLCEKHLIELMDRLFGDKYDLVLKESYRSGLLYTRVAIEDVTTLAKQELLRELPPNE